MFARSILCFATTALVAGFVANSAFAIDSRPSASNAETVTATRLQVEVNCQGEGDRSYGTYGFGGYGCAKANGTRIDCKPDGTCQAGDFSIAPKPQDSSS